MFAHGLPLRGAPPPPVRPVPVILTKLLISSAEVCHAESRAGDPPWRNLGALAPARGRQNVAQRANAGFCSVLIAAKPRNGATEPNSTTRAGHVAHPHQPQLPPGLWNKVPRPVSQSQVGRVAAYVRNQEEHHRKMTFREELIALF